MEDLIGKRVMLRTRMQGTILKALSKEETKECNMFGQLIQVELDNGTIEEHCYDYEFVQDNEEEIEK